RHYSIYYGYRNLSAYLTACAGYFSASFYRTEIPAGILFPAAAQPPAHNCGRFVFVGAASREGCTTGRNRAPTTSTASRRDATFV
ncbi:MAG: hypothetical protein LBD52_02895, partial [Prevotellaceae bacterium]|nr:hypothetical protein [Prevotellaceae bacterium]